MQFHCCESDTVQVTLRLHVRRWEIIIRNHPSADGSTGAASDLVESGCDLNENSYMWRFRNIDLHRNRKSARTLCVAMVVGFACLATSASVMLGDEPTGSGTRTAQKGRKYVNKIPYDVFFDRPLEIAKDRQVEKSSVAPSAPESQQSIDRKPPTVETPAAAEGEHNANWSELLPVEELQDEVKALRSSLTKHLSSQGQYNQNFKSISIDGGVLASLAVVVQDRNDPLTWKENAAYVREFGNQIREAAIGLGRENFDKSKSAFQRLTAVLDGSLPADAGEVTQSVPWQEAVSRKSAMKRIEAARDRLKQDINTESKFKAQADRIRHESSIISTLATLISTEGFEFAENQDYQEPAHHLIDGAREAAEATSVESYEKFKSAIDKINKSCTDCHANYGNG